MDAIRTLLETQPLFTLKTYTGRLEVASQNSSGDLTAWAVASW